MQAQFPSQALPLSLGKYTVLFSELLGRGTTGSVFKGLDNTTKRPVAVKVIDLASIKDDATRSLLQNQKMALQTVENVHVVQLKDILEQDGRCYIVTQLCEGETLRQLILKRGKLPQEEAMTIFRKILAGCLSITQNCIIHRDLKPANIIVSPPPALQTKIIDFGFCELIRAKKVMRTFNVGSPSYMAPQAYLRTLYSEKSDSWSLGMILFQMLHGRTLDQGQNIKEYFEILKNNPNYVLPFVTGFSENVKQILEKALKYLPEERMSISSMKYAADLYHIRKTRQEPASSSSLSSTQPASFRSFKQTQSLPLNHPPPQTHTLHNISTETLNCPKKESFISFADFSKPQHRQSNKASQISLCSSNNKNSSVQYSLGGRTNQNYQYMANKLPLEAYQSLSSKDVLERRPRGPPAFRQVTVRYL